MKLRFKLTQHQRDDKLLRSLVTYLRCGSYTSEASRNVGNFICEKFSDIHDKIIPFFTKYPIHGVKALDFADFVQVADLIKDKRHLAEEGLEAIISIKQEMNRNRKNDS